MPLQARGDPSPDVSIIIVSWNVRELLHQCLISIIEGDATGGLSYEIIIVDNASRDGSAEAASHFEGVRVVRSVVNMGYGRANNVGLRLAKGAHLLILNPDTVPARNSIERMVAFQRSRPNAGIVSPRLLNSDGTVQPAAFRFPTLVMAALDLFPLPAAVPGSLRQRLYRSALNGRYPGEDRRNTPFRIDHPLGACILLSRKAYTAAGGFDPTIFMYSEEIDLAIRYKEAGWECWQVPVAHVTHLGAQSTRQMPDRMNLELWRSRLYMYRKHYSLPSQIILALLLLLRQCWTLIGLLFSVLSRKLNRDAAGRKLKQVLLRSKLAVKG